MPSVAAIKAVYANNTFTIQASRVGSVEVKISPLMVDMSKPVRISVNGKELYNGLVITNKEYYWFV